MASLMENRGGGGGPPPPPPAPAGRGAEILQVLGKVPLFGGAHGKKPPPPPKKKNWARVIEAAAYDEHGLMREITRRINLKNSSFKIKMPLTKAP